MSRSTVAFRRTWPAKTFARRELDRDAPVLADRLRRGGERAAERLHLLPLLGGQLAHLVLARDRRVERVHVQAQRIREDRVEEEEHRDPARAGRSGARRRGSSRCRPRGRARRGARRRRRARARGRCGRCGRRTTPPSGRCRPSRPGTRRGCAAGRRSPRSAGPRRRRRRARRALRRRRPGSARRFPARRSSCADARETVTCATSCPCARSSSPTRA